MSPSVVLMSATSLAATGAAAAGAGTGGTAGAAGGAGGAGGTGVAGAVAAGVAGAFETAGLAGAFETAGCGGVVSLFSPQPLKRARPITKLKQHVKFFIGGSFATAPGRCHAKNLRKSADRRIPPLSNLPSGATVSWTDHPNSELPMTNSQWQILDFRPGVTPHMFSALKTGN